MWKPLLTLTLLESSCVSTGGNDAICAGTAKARTTHAAALADDGGPLSVVSGAALIAQLDAGCK